MHKLLCAVLISLIVIGCEDPDAKNRAIVSQQFDEAVAAFNQAEIGYAPKGQDDYNAFRLQALDKVASILNKISRDQGITQQQKTASAQMLAAIDATKARSLTKQANGNWAQIANNATALNSQFINLDKADRRAREFDRDESQQIQTLSAGRDEISASIPDINNEIEQLKQKINQLNPDIESYRQQADKLRAQARDFEDKAFITTGDKHYDHMDNATNLDRQASVASVAADKLVVELDIVTSRLKILNQQLALAQESITQFNRQIAEASARNQLYAQQRTAAIKDRAAALEKLSAQYKTIATAFESDVNQIFTKASLQITESVDKLDSAVRRAGKQRQQVELDLLSARTTKAYVITQHTLAIRTMLGTLNSLADHADRLLNGLGDSVKQQINTYNQTNAQLTAEITKTIALGLTEAQEIGSDGDSPQDLAVQQAIQQFQSYQNQLSLDMTAAVDNQESSDNSE